MNEATLHSIKIEDIDLEKCYFNPGCALSIYNPKAEYKLQEILCTYFGKVKLHNTCCHHDPGLPQGSTIINNCAGCDRRFRSLYEGIQTVSIWEVLDSIEDLPLPDYSGMTVSVQDSCSFRKKPQVHAAVRSLLRKMKIEIIDAELSGTKSVCCGDNFYPQLSIEKVTELQKKRASHMPCQDVVVYCVSCIKSMAIGGKTPHHMVDLLLGDATDPGDVRIDIYHEELNRYIDCH